MGRGRSRRPPAKVIPLRAPDAGTFTIPLADGARLSLVPCRESPEVMLVLYGPGGGNAGGVILHRDRARLLGTWLQRLADDGGVGAHAKRRPAIAVSSRVRDALAPLLAEETALPAFPRLAVPSFADWCTIDVLEPGGRMRRLAVAAADPLRADVAHALTGYSPDPHGTHPKAQVLRTGRPDFATEITDARMAALAQDAEHLAILRSLGFRSAVTVPLVVRRRVLGVMTFATAESGRRYREDDLGAALAFAHCAALTLDNARGYRRAERTLAARVNAPRVLRPRNPKRS